MIEILGKVGEPIEVSSRFDSSVERVDTPSATHLGVSLKQLAVSSSISRLLNTNLVLKYFIKIRIKTCFKLHSVPKHLHKSNLAQL